MDRILELLNFARMIANVACETLDLAWEQIAFMYAAKDLASKCKLGSEIREVQAPKSAAFFIQSCIINATSVVKIFTILRVAVCVLISIIVISFTVFIWKSFFQVFLQNKKNAT